MSSLTVWGAAAALAVSAMQASSVLEQAGDPAQSMVAGRITGRVTAANGQPPARARVTVTSDDQGATRAVLTDAQGRSAIDPLPHGRYASAAVLTGYVVQPFEGAATTIDLTRDQQAAAIEFVLQPAGAINGRILDENGTPLAGATVSALRSTIEAGHRTWTAAATTGSDDRGEFHLSGLAAGTYLVSASDPAIEHAASERDAQAYAPTYYPGVVSVESAGQVVVDPARGPNHIEFRLHVVPPSRVSGRMSAWNKRDLLSAAVIISPQDGRGPLPPVVEARMTPEGNFTFANVPAGRYVIRARGETDRQGATLFASFAVAIEGRGLGNIDLVLAPGGTIAGRVSATPKHGYPPPLLHGLRVLAPLADGTAFGETPSGSVGQHGEFRLTGVIAGSHVLTVDGLTFPWRIEQAITQGRDVTSAAFDVNGQQDLRDATILLTDTAAGVSGTITRPPGVLSADVLVVAFAADALKRLVPMHFVRCGRPSSDGAYRLVGLAPGDYLVAAVIGIAEDEVTRPAILERLKTFASPVRLIDAQVASMSLSARPLASRAPSP